LRAERGRLAHFAAHEAVWGFGDSAVFSRDFPPPQRRARGV
jgi:hypothetical protein